MSGPPMLMDGSDGWIDAYTSLGCVRMLMGVAMMKLVVGWYTTRMLQSHTPWPLRKP